MSTRRQKKENKGDRIASSALALFSQKGYASTTVSDIAKASGVGKGTIYEYFSTKEAIFVAALKEWMARFESRLEKCLVPLSDPVQKLYALAQANSELVDAIDPATLRLSAEFLQQSLLEDGVLYRRRHLMKEMYTGQCRLVMDILLDGISKGLFRPEIAKDTEKIAINLLACFDGIFLHSVMSENYFDLKEQVAFYIDNLVRSIRLPENEPQPAE
jgi:TetR/AcrR family fatty acid metabolism transcriptional regulator